MGIKRHRLWDLNLFYRCCSVKFESIETFSDKLPLKGRHERKLKKLQIRVFFKIYITLDAALECIPI